MRSLVRRIAAFIVGVLWVAGPVLAESYHIAQVGGIELPGLPLSVTDPSSREKTRGAPSHSGTQRADPAPTQANLVPQSTTHTTSTRSVPLPPLVLRAEPGVARVVPISMGMVNQIVVPFSAVDVKTVNQADISVSGNSIFVATESVGAIGMIITDGQNYADAITLTLVPQDIPPRQIRITLIGVDRESTASQSSASEMVATGGNPVGNAPYKERLTETLRMIALGKVPSGFALAEPDERYGCRSPLDTKPAQLIEGGKIKVYVLAAKNNYDSPFEFVESDCYSPGVLGVAAWPNVRLHPGEETEIYIVTSNVPSRKRLTARPKVTFGESQ